MADPGVLIRKFKTETYPMVAVSVGMLDTGFDCREILHLVLCRRVRSPILYQQMRGRGTRTAPHIGKRTFVVYDFFRNHQYFNDSDTDVFTGGVGGRVAGRPGRTRRRFPARLVELGLEDEWLEAVTYVEVGPGGRACRQGAVRQRLAAGDPVTRAGRPAASERCATMTRSTHTRSIRSHAVSTYRSGTSMRRICGAPIGTRAGTLVDFIRAALGRLHIKSREEQTQ